MYVLAAVTGTIWLSHQVNVYTVLTDWLVCGNEGAVGVAQYSSLLVTVVTVHEEFL